jgi:hypothetical protein
LKSSAERFAAAKRKAHEATDDIDLKSGGQRTGNKHLLGKKPNELLGTVQTLLEKHPRASSAIEGFNAALSPHMYIHNGVTQNFRELFRYFKNYVLGAGDITEALPLTSV